MKIRITAAVLLTVVITAAAIDAQGERVSEMIEGSPMYTVLDFDAIPSIDEPIFVTAGEGDNFLQENEMVIGVVAGSDAKAYSTWQLDHHEIVNDVIGETPIAATW